MGNVFGTSSGDDAADRRFEYARGLAARGDHAAAAELLEQALERAPAWPPLHFHLGEALRLSGNAERAGAAFEQYLSLDPADRMGAHVKRALINGESPDKLPDHYIAALFDEYAPRFDRALVENLQYKTPEQIRAALPQRSYESLLDLGCGTGLAAEALKDITSRWVGVDLSPGMVEQARGKNLYDALEVASLEDFFATNTERFDLIVAADVFVYIGDLKDILKNCANALKAGGALAFSVQKLDTGNFSLGADHRYAHSQNYIEGCAAADLTLLSCENAILRKDGANDIEGMIFVLKKYL